MDPISLVVAAVVAGPSAGLKDAAAAAVKDTYASLKTILARKNIDVSALERRPNSTAQREAIQETLRDLTDQGDGVDEELLAAASATVEAVAEHDLEAARVVGVSLTDIQAEFIRIGQVQSSGDGVVANNIRTSGGLTIDAVDAGNSAAPGNPT